VGTLNAHLPPALQALDLDTDWDPHAHDEQMGALYGSGEAEDEDTCVDEEKPIWEDDIDIGDIAPDWDHENDGADPSTMPRYDDAGEKKKKKKKKKKGAKQDGENEGVNVDMMDAEKANEEDGEWDEEQWDGTEEMRKRVWKKYMDEIDAMEFNDMVIHRRNRCLLPLNYSSQVGDLPTRFKYTPVDSDTFGLTPAEILMATDAELNSYIGLKRYAPYRVKAANKWDAKRNERLRELRQGLNDRGAYGVIEEMGAGVGEGAMSERKKKRKGKKERLKAKAGAGEDEEGEQYVLGKRKDIDVDGAGQDDMVTAEGKKKRRRHKKAATE
jgi:protein KRI1